LASFETVSHKGPVISYFPFLINKIKSFKYSELKGDKPKGDFQTYISKDGESFSVGDTVLLGAPTGKDDEFIYITTFGIMSAVFSSTSLGSSGTSTSNVIRKILIGGSKGSGWKVILQTGKSTGGLNIILENAIDSGEIKRKGMTSDEALTELKKAKDKLDLGLINQAEYDSLKAELVKYIK